MFTKSLVPFAVLPVDMSSTMGQCGSETLTSGRSRCNTILRIGKWKRFIHQLGPKYSGWHLGALGLLLSTVNVS